ncbi:MAG: HAD hydrolase-like protein [Firmicutes bacterium]|nr:HAD hydrolase-like protein [Bacillota bacterium]
MKYKLIIFDFDGTLADSVPWFTRNINKIAEKYKFRLIGKEENEVIKDYNFIKMLKYLGVPFWKIPLIESQLRKLMAEGIQNISLFAGVDNLLQTLSNNGITLAIVTSNSEKTVRQILGPQNASLISYYECGAAFSDKKNKLRKVLKRSGFLDSESIYIGDEVRDGEAARKANIAFGGVLWGYSSKNALNEQLPKEIFFNINEILKLI